MTSYNLSNKEKKALIEFNREAKNSFPAYYVNILSEAFAPREVYNKRDSYSFVRDMNNSLNFLFNVFNLSHQTVIALNYVAISACAGKLGAIDAIETIGTKLYLVMNEIKPKELEKIKTFTEERDGKYIVNIGSIRNINETIDNVYKYSVPSSFEGYTEISSTDLEDILDKQEVFIENNGFHITVFKPLFPGINKKCRILVNFVPFPGNDEEFIANFLMIKEQVYSYHKYIGIIW